MISFIESCDIKNKNVFLRIDGNVPLKDGMILDDFRLRAVLPTIEYLLRAGATNITVGTHLGRPADKQDKKLSVAPLARWFAGQNLSRVYLLENLRFDPREKRLDIGFARELAAGHDVYINDAWGALHRTETSITVLPTLFTPKNRAYGLLVERELRALTPLRDNPKKPYIVLLGGGKLPDKLEALYRLVEKKLVTTVVLLPGIVFTFMAAALKIPTQIPTGSSLVFPELFERCRQFLTLAEQNGIRVVMPEDFIWQNGTVGAETIATIKKITAHAETIFYNGAMGIDTGNNELKDILTDISKSGAYTIIGGGDSVAAAEKFGLTKNFSWCSTGGGSTLAFISGAQLPGLL